MELHLHSYAPCLEVRSWSFTSTPTLHLLQLKVLDSYVRSGNGHVFDDTPLLKVSPWSSYLMPSLPCRLTRVGLGNVLR
jgi:hypothetical protein